MRNYSGIETQWVQESYKEVDGEQKKRVLNSNAHADKRKSIASLSSFKSDSNKSHRNSFVSIYGKQTRYESIMRLKVTPAHQRSTREDRTIQALCENKEPDSIKDKQTRFQRIMDIKVMKPQVSSTLLNYQPPSGQKVLLERKENTVHQWSDCKQRARKAVEQQEKENRAWKLSERQRQIKLQKEKAERSKQEVERRRKQQLFQHLVVKEIVKLEKDRQIAQRKEGGFSTYVYPAY